MTPFRGARTLLVLAAASGVLLGLLSIAQAPRAQQIITYADGENRTAPIDISQVTQLQVATGTATQSGVIFQTNPAPQLQKAGAGTLVLSGANTYTNQTLLLSGGALNIQNDTALGATGGGAVASGTIVATGAALETQGNITVGAEALLLNGTGIGGGGALRNISGNNTYGGAITLNTAARINSDSGVLTLGNFNVISAGQNLTVGGAGDTTVSGVIATGNGTLTKDGTGTLTLLGPGFYQGVTTISAGVLNIRNGNALGSGFGGTTVANGAALELQQGIVGSVFVGPEALTLNGTGIADGGALRNISGNNTYGGPITLGGAARINSDAGTLTVGGSIGGLGQNLTVGGAGNTTISSAIGIGTGSLTKDGAGTLILTGNNTYSGGTTVSGGTLQGNTTSLQGNILNNANVTFNQLTAGTYAGAISGGGSLAKIGAGTLTLTGNNTQTGGTTINGGAISVAADANLGGAAGTLAFGGGTLQTTGTFSMSRATTLNSGGGTFDAASGTTLTHDGAIGGIGGLTKSGAGTLVLLGNNLYSGGTTVSGGVLQGDTTSLQGTILNNANVAFNQATTGTYAGAMSGTGSLSKSGSGTLILSGSNSYSGGTTVSAGILQGNTLSLQGTIVNNASVVFNQTGSGTYAGTMSGAGGLTLQGGGTLTITGNNLYAGPTTVTGSGLVVNGSLASTVTLDSMSTLGGTGTLGGVISNGAMLMPGNSIGTLNITGNFSQNGGTYQVEVNPAGQSDRLNVTGTATINGATVQVVAASGSYGTSTTYTILNATGGVSGTYSSVTSNFAFLTPSLTYDLNNVFLTLALLQNGNPSSGGFLLSAYTPNQKAVGYALNQSLAGATGDFATVINALSGLTAFQGPAALNAISGEQYADFGTMNVNNSAMFMNAIGQQMALARSGTAAPGQRAALAMACDIAACDGQSPLSVWGSALGGFGAAAGDYNASTATYNYAGAAVGIDYRLDPRFLVGLGVGYTAGNLWVNSFPGKGWTNNVSVAAYGSFTQGGFYADLLGGYAYYNNQLQRQIVIPGLQPLTAQGNTGANQVLGQIETGYRVGIYAPADATLTPFARLQGSSVTQNAFTESGAQSLNLGVAQQTTNSLRTLFGVDLAGNVPLGTDRTLDLGLRLGWQHEFASTIRPITAALSGAPFAAFTVYGATPQPDAAVVSFRANTRIAEQAQIYLRYDGEIGSGTDNHAFNLGLRINW
jgi:fibronectin-binding autotransporter adhesin